MTDFSKSYSQTFLDTFKKSVEVKESLTGEDFAVLDKIAQTMLQSLRKGSKVILFGNGGSAADSQHIAAELVSKFAKDRKAIAAMALTTDTSILTSVANDYAYEEVFARQIAALGQAGDVAVGISTSGNSPNVLKAVQMAKQKGLFTVGFAGKDGGKLKEVADICFCAPSQSTARIQEVHITAAHALCDILEQELG